MKLLVAALVTLSAFHYSHARREGDTVPEYTIDDCNGWIEDANSYDADASGGLNQEEYYNWLVGSGLISADASFEEIALPLKVSFLGLACECQALGYGEDCCTGADAEFPISDINGTSLPPTPSPTVDAAETLSVSIVGSVLDYSSFDYSGILDGSSKPTYYDAAEINANEGDNNVIAELTEGYQLLADELMSGMRRSLRASNARRLQTLNTVTAADVADCPADLVYAPEGALCLNFTFDIDTSALSEEDAATFADQLETAINDGELYDKVKYIYPDTLISGLGSPGSGIDYTVPSNATSTEAPPVDESSKETTTTAEASSSDGLGTTAIVFIVIGVLAVPLIIAGLLKGRSTSEPEVAKTRELPSGDGEDDDVYYDGPSDMKASRGVGSSLAAMGAAGSAAALIGTMSSSEIEEEIRRLVDETNAPKSADELLAAYAGREAELLKNLRKLKVKTDKEAAMIAEIRTLAEETNASKTADEMLELYKGREQELLNNLRKLYAQKQPEIEAKKMRAEIITLVEELNIPKSPDEMLAAYEGREQELLKNLRKMKAKEDTKAEIEALVVETGAPKSAEELLASYAGREEQLLKNLRKMKAKQVNDAEIKAEVEALVDELNIPKTADDMLASYAGREDELLKNLRKMKAKEDVKAEVKTLASELGVPKSADEMLASYAGREEELLKNLRKLKVQKATVAEMKAEIEILVSELDVPKTADEMMASYIGREAELLRNLRKMKAKEDVKAEVRTLTDELGVPKTADEMLASYAGREEELLKNLKKMKANNERVAGIKGEVEVLVKELEVPKTADEMMASYAGREEVLLKNLKKMKAKQEQDASIKAEVEELVKELGVPKTADEMLASYAGREAELLRNLKKMMNNKEKTDKIKAEVEILVKDLDIPKSADEMLASYVGREEELGVPKTADELLASYAGREEELFRNLKKMMNTKEKNENKIKAEVESIAAELDLPKSAEEMLSSFAGREEELLKNLRKMKEKKTGQAATGSVDAQVRAEVEELVQATNTVKSADELLAAYEGREQELISHLKKLKASNRDLQSL
ncbi:hypothetical protein ACHAWU_006080 [Discostella pseudostelligera]|uniref:Uncharacterized protein n=1 Tax=Discostella pseudostelligera TaxID=259834 RepID=A0ABD3M2Z7_9STRA